MERNFKVGSLAWVAVLAMSGVTAAHADTTTTSTATAPSVQPRLIDKLTLSYYGAYFGPSLSDMNANTPGNTPEDDGLQRIENTITAGYKVTPDVLVGAAFNFNEMPTRGTGLQLKDPYLKISNSKAYHNGNFNVYADLRSYAGVTDASKAKGLVAAFRPNQNITYDIGRLTVGSYSFVKAFVYDSRGAGSNPIYSLVEAPYANYKLTETVSATMWIDLVQLTHKHGPAGFLSMTNDPVDVEPGINWDITPKISINPYINIFPEHASLRSSSIGLIVAAKAL
ncbi:MAG: hypothetical protein H7222_17550 [Methylotenera sp.]|nr:hypothetical protein [Oligoflexia bacterium]